MPLLHLDELSDAANQADNDHHRHRAAICFGLRATRLVARRETYTTAWDITKFEPMHPNSGPAQVPRAEEAGLCGMFTTADRGCGPRLQSLQQALCRPAVL